MKEAFKCAQEAFLINEVPVGAVIVSNKYIIARAHNQTEMLTDVTAHAEMIAITAAADYLSGKYLQDCTLYVTLEPCLMCFGAIMNARISRIVFGAYDNKKDVFRLSADVEKKDFFNHKIVVAGGVLDTECSKILKNFFTSRRVLLK